MEDANTYVRSWEPVARPRAVQPTFAARYGRLVAAVAGLTIILGILRGLAGGVLSVLTTPYGLTWIAAIGLALAIAAFEGARLSPSVGRLIAASRPEEVRALDKRIANQGAINSPDFSSFSASWSRCASATDMPGWQAATRGPGSSEPGSFFSESPGDEFGLLAQSALT